MELQVLGKNDDAMWHLLREKNPSTVLPAVATRSSCHTFVSLLLKLRPDHNHKRDGGNTSLLRLLFFWMWQGFRANFPIFSLFSHQHLEMAGKFRVREVPVGTFEVGM